MLPFASGSVCVVGLCGSLRRDGYTRAALRAALDGEAEEGAATDLVDLRDYDLPFCTGADKADVLPGEGKVVGLAGVSGGRMGGASTLNTLRAIGRALHAWVIPWEAWIYDAATAFAPDGSLIDASSERRLKQVGRKVARLTQMLVSK